MHVQTVASTPPVLPTSTSSERDKSPQSSEGSLLSGAPRKIVVPTEVSVIFSFHVSENSGPGSSVSRNETDVKQLV